MAMPPQAVHHFVHMVPPGLTAQGLAALTAKKAPAKKPAAKPVAHRAAHKVAPKPVVKPGAKPGFPPGKPQSQPVKPVPSTKRQGPK